MSSKSDAFLEAKDTNIPSHFWGGELMWAGGGAQKITLAKTELDCYLRKVGANCPFLDSLQDYENTCQRFS